MPIVLQPDRKIPEGTPHLFQNISFVEQFSRDPHGLRTSVHPGKACRPKPRTADILGSTLSTRKAPSGAVSPIFALRVLCFDSFLLLAASYECLQHDA